MKTTDWGHQDAAPLGDIRDIINLGGMPRLKYTMFHHLSELVEPKRVPCYLCDKNSVSSAVLLQDMVIKNPSTGEQEEAHRGDQMHLCQQCLKLIGTSPC